MLTVDFRRFPVRPGDRVLDLGCGGGRHAFEVYRRGADVVAFDLDPAELAPVTGMFGAMRAAGEASAEAGATAISGDATAMPFGDGMFDRVIAAEVLEHVLDDQRAMNELARVLRPGGLAAITVPSFLPERVCWALSTEYHEVPGGHVRIYTRVELQAKLARAGLTALWHHHAHGLHSPYWWLKCAVGVHNDKHRLTSAYHRVLVWDIMRKPAVTRLAEQALNPLIGKSLVVYAVKAELSMRARLNLSRSERATFFAPLRRRHAPVVSAAGGSFHGFVSSLKRWSSRALYWLTSSGSGFTAEKLFGNESPAVGDGNEPWSRIFRAMGSIRVDGIILPGKVAPPRSGSRTGTVAAEKSPLRKASVGTGCRLVKTCRRLPPSYATKKKLRLRTRGPPAVAPNRLR